MSSKSQSALCSGSVRRWRPAAESLRRSVFLAASAATPASLRRSTRGVRAMITDCHLLDTALIRRFKRTMIQQARVRGSDTPSRERCVADTKLVNHRPRTHYQSECDELVRRPRTPDS